jgi:hypothetical protein
MGKRIDWDKEAHSASRMTLNELHYAILDAQKTLPAADAMDRANGTCDGGFYRDQISVYRAEQKRRRGGKS